MPLSASVSHAMESLLLDVRHAGRVLARNRRFTIVAVLTLALGIGVNAAVFTAYKAMLLRPLDAERAEEMVNLALVRPRGATQFTFSYPDTRPIGAPPGPSPA